LSQRTFKADNLEIDFYGLTLSMVGIYHLVTMQLTERKIWRRIVTVYRRVGTARLECSCGIGICGWRATSVGT